MLGAYYYPWYGRPTPPILAAGDWGSGYTNHPLLGEYNSQDTSVITQHTQWAKSSGIDFFAMSWPGPRTWEDITLKSYLSPALKGAKIKFCIHYETTRALNKIGLRLSYDLNDEYIPAKAKGQKFLEDFGYLADMYFSKPQYLRINDRPLVIIRLARYLHNAQTYLTELEEDMKKKGFNPFLVADVVFWAGIRLTSRSFVNFWKTPLLRGKAFYQAIIRSFLRDPEWWNFISKHFGAITGYDMYQPNGIRNFLKGVDQEFQRFQDKARVYNLVFIPFVMPGYDDRSLRGTHRPVLERRKGEFFKEFGEVAKKYADPYLKLILITTFNEWHEGTEIEPSKENGTTYLELTKALSESLQGG